MARKILTEEQREEKRRIAKEMWARRRAEKEQQEQATEEQSQPEAPAPTEAEEQSQEEEKEQQEQTLTEQTQPDVSPTEAETMSSILQNTKIIRDSMQIIRNRNGDMIETRQAVDALDEAIARMGQVEGLLRSK